MDNRVILKQMVRLSRIIKDFKEARAKLNSIKSQATYFIVEGEKSDLIRNKTGSSILDCLYTEQYLKTSISNACKCLDGFDAGTMEAVDYVSSSDVKNKFIDICKGKNVVATIDLSTGVISLVKPEHETAEEKSPTVKS